MDINRAFEEARKFKFDEVVMKRIIGEIQQVKFSNNEIDISNNWNEETLEIYVSKGKKIYSFDIRREKDLESGLELASKALKIMEDNPDFYAINSNKFSYRKRNNRYEEIDEIQPSKFVNDFLQEHKKYAKRMGGVFYKKKSTIEVLTNYNYISDSNMGVEFNIRAFNDDDVPTQQSFASSSDGDVDNLYSVGHELIDHLRLMKKKKEGENGKFPVVLHPLIFASLVSYTIPMASAFQVDTGISLFTGRMNQKIGSQFLTIYDDPADDGMFGSRIADDEAVPTRKTPIVEKGYVKNFLHNTSTARKFGTETTGNAGIMAPTPWQVSVEPGTEDPSEMISSLRDGLYIVNTWYTRFQDYREGVFSTIPRDGIYKIKNGEIVENWLGIRISDSLLNIFKNIEGISKDTKKVKWWDETMYCKVPYVYVSSVNITKSK